MEGVNFFGLEIELWQIGGSPVAPKFNVVSKPNDWTKQVATATRSEASVTDLKRQQRTFWEGLAARIHADSSSITPRKPQAQHWADFAIGRTNFSLSVALNSREDFIEVGLYLKGADAEAHFHLLEDEREAIEQEIGEPLIWDPKPGAQWFWVGTRWNDEDSTDEAQWASQHERIASTLDRFHAAFSARVRQLDATQYVPAALDSDDGYQS
mgnify:FL=1